jgi:hypothetical protein
LSTALIRFLPVLLTGVGVAWTAVISRFTRFDDNSAAYPLVGLFVLSLVVHIWMIVKLRPRWGLVLYGILHLPIQAYVFTYCSVIITKNAL